jgi:hypothetical protein
MNTLAVPWGYCSERDPRSRWAGQEPLRRERLGMLDAAPEERHLDMLAVVIGHRERPAVRE